MRQPPKPRESYFMGMHRTSHIQGNGTWIEPEELCYPKGGFTRKCYAMCEDGIKRVVTCSIPDTYFTIPAYRNSNGKRLKGYVSSDENGYKFTAYKEY